MTVVVTLIVENDTPNICEDCNGTGINYEYEGDDEGWVESGDCKTCGGSGLAENDQ